MTVLGSAFHPTDRPNLFRSEPIREPNFECVLEISLDRRVGPAEEEEARGDVYTCLEIPCTFHINSPNAAQDRGGQNTKEQKPNFINIS